MRSFTGILILLFSYSLFFSKVLSGQGKDLPSITSKSGTVNLVLANVCTYYSVLTLNEGIDSAGYLPTIGYGCFPMMGPFNYTHFDSLRPMNEKVRDFEFEYGGMPSVMDKFFYVGRDSSVIAYKIRYPNQTPCQSVISAHDTIYADSIQAIHSPTNNRFSLIRNVAPPQTNFIVYDDSLSGIQFSMSLNIKPKLINGGPYCAIIGLDSLNRTVLKIIDLINQTIIKDTLTGPITANPYKLFSLGGLVYLASSPGDSCISILKYNLSNNTCTTAVIYNQSGIHSGDWEGGYFHYQPESDSTSSNSDLRIFVFDAFNMTPLANYVLNRRFKLIDYGGDGSGFFPYIYCTEEDSLTAMLRTFVFYTNYQAQDTILTGQNPSYFIGDFRCDVGIDEYDDGLVTFKAYPNPTQGDINLTASGLICGRDYKLDMVDINGKVLLEKTIQAKMTLNLSFSEQPSGIYFLRIHTRKGFVVQKIIKQ